MTADIEKKIHQTFQYLHDNAELSWEEVETTNYLKKLLEEHGCETITFDDCTGVVGKYGNFDAGLPVVAIRGDIDALWQEVDGEFKANHSCGHDAHMSIALGALWLLQARPELKDKVALKVVFQPAEEVGAGALKMVEKGVIDDVEYFYGLHLRPIAETVMGRASPVIIHGATRRLIYAIKGDDAHAARPHLNKNAIEIGSEILQLVSNIHIDPRIPYSAKMTQFQAGGRSGNIIPGSATFTLDLRAQNNDTMEILVNKVKNIVDSIKTLYNVDISLTKESGIVAAVTNDEAIAIAEAAIIKQLGEEGLEKPIVTPGGDDFHYYTVKKPALKATMIGLGCDLEPGLHHPNMRFNHDALINGAKVLYQMILDTYKI